MPPLGHFYGVPQSVHIIALVGAGIGYLTGLVAITGAINTPFFLAFSLVKGANIGAEAASSLALFLAKQATSVCLRLRIQPLDQ